MSVIPIVRRHLAIQADRFTEVVKAAPEAAINWRPSDETTNSIAQLVRHVLAYQEFFLATTLAESVIHDEAAFERMHAQSLRDEPATRDQLLGLLADARARMEEQMARLEALDVEENVVAFSGRSVSRLSMLVRAPVHAAEHLGHAELTRQMWEQYATQR
jgi:hypothetical protein